VSGSDVPEIDVHTLHGLWTEGVALIDVREPDEWVTVRVPDVALIPMAEITARVDELPTAGPLYVICASGARSHRVAEYLRGQGVDAVNVAGGTKGWYEAGYEVESGPSTE
jgi:rhodanese-related sulfurtransferase